MEHYDDILDNLDWNGLKLLLAVVETGSFRKAAQTLDVAVNMLRRRIEKLEQQFGHAILIRDHGGIRVTPFGAELLKASAEMVEAAKPVGRLLRRRDRQILGSVSLSVTEGLGTFWLIPRMIDFQRAHPHISLDLRCAMGLADVFNMEVDVGVQIEYPNAPDLVVTKLGTLHMMLFASEEYVRVYGEPRSISEILNYRFVEQVSGQVNSSMLDEMFPNVPQDFVAVRTNTSTSHAYANSRGAGIGVLPTYARAITKRVRPVCPDFRFSRSIWMTYNRNALLSERVVATLDWLRKSFDSKRYPWFSESFIAPEVFERQFSNAASLHLFDGFRDE